MLSGVNTKSVSFFYQLKKNSVVVVVPDRITTWHAKTSTYQPTTVLEDDDLLYLHYHIARLAWLIQEYLFLVKVIRTNTKKSVEVGLFVTSLIHSFSVVDSNSKQ